MAKVDVDYIEGEVARIAGGKRNNMKAVLAAIEKIFNGIALIAVDTEKDTVIFGHKYVDAQVDMSEDECGFDGVDPA